MDAPRRFGSVVLVSGPESLLAERAIADLVGQARTERPDASVRYADAVTLDLGSLTEMTGGSLFAENQIVVIEGLDQTPSELFDPIVSLVSQPSDELALFLVHPGGARGRGLVDKLKKAKVEVIEAPAVKTWELPAFAVNEARRAGGRISQPTATRLVEALGGDVRTVAGAIRQLLADSDDGTITDEIATRYFVGRGEVTSFSVADAVMAGQRNEALGSLRWALDNGVAPVLICSAIVSGLRNLGRFMDARDARMRDVDLAKSIGVPPWKIKDLKRQASDWTPRGIADSLVAAARVDAEIKGAASDPGFSLEQLVIEVTGNRGRRPDANLR